MDNVFVITHTPRMVDQTAEQTNFVLDTEVSDYLCALPGEIEVVSKDKVHTQADAVRIFLGRESYEDFREKVFSDAEKAKKTMEQKTGDKYKKAEKKYLEKLAIAENRINKVDEYRNKLENDPELNFEQDTLTTGEVAVGRRLKQIVLPTARGNMVVSPLPPLLLTWFLGDLFRVQKQVIDKLWEKPFADLKNKPRNAFVKYVIEQVQNTGIPAKDKTFARIKNFPPFQSHEGQTLTWALDARSHTVWNVVIAVLYRQAYVRRTGGLLGNVGEESGRQINSDAEQRLKAACWKLADQIWNRLDSIRSSIFSEGDLVVPSSWPDVVQQFVSGGSPQQDDYAALVEELTKKQLRTIEYAVSLNSKSGKDSSKPKPASVLYDYDRRRISEFLSEAFSEKVKLWV